MSDLRLYLLGPPRIEYQNTPVKIVRRKALALAAYVALSERPLSRDVVAGTLWPDLDEDHARSALRSALYALTTQMPVDWIQTHGRTLALNHEVVWVDVRVFMDFVSRRCTRNHSLHTICDACVTDCEQAAALYTGDFLLGFGLPDTAEFEEWLLARQEWLRREFAGILRRLSQYYMDAEQPGLAVSYTQHWLATDPLSEPAHRQLMRLFAANGRRSEALRQYQRCVEVLNAELATPPDAETTRLYEAIQDNQPSAIPTGDIRAGPIPGILPPLPPFVIGREDALGGIKRRLGIGGSEMRPSTVIQGWPGVGKSTIVAKLAHDPEIAHQFPDGILWASLGEKPDITGEIGAWAEALAIGESGRSRKTEEISAQITAALRDRRVLLIVDDIWQPEHAIPFRVGGQASALVMTSRLNDVAGALAPAAGDIYRLGVLSEDAGFELLGKLTPETVAQFPGETRELVRDLEGLPLAIHVAGRLLQAEARLGWGVSELLVELREGRKLLVAKPPHDMLGIERDASPTVAALLKRSSDALDMDTRIRFALLGLFVPKPATFDLPAMAALWDVSDPKPFARKLVARGLLEPVGGGRFQMHALLMLHARTLLETEAGGLS